MHLFTLWKTARTFFSQQVFPCCVIAWKRRQQLVAQAGAVLKSSSFQTEEQTVLARRWNVMWKRGCPESSP